MEASSKGKVWSKELGKKMGDETAKSESPGGLPLKGKKLSVKVIGDYPILSSQGRGHRSKNSDGHNSLQKSAQCKRQHPVHRLYDTDDQGLMSDEKKCAIRQFSYTYVINLSFSHKIMHQRYC